MLNECKRIKDILDAQIDRNEAIRDFIEKYGFIMREFYCSRICEERFHCALAQQYNPK
jgi:hypothetical protein